MEVIQWTSLWNKYKDEFEKEKSMVGGSLGDKADEDLKLRIIEHVSLSMKNHCCWQMAIYLLLIFFSIFSTEYSRCLKVLLKDHLKETCRASMPKH